MNTKQAEEAIQKIIFKHLSPEEHQVFLFGSRAGGTSRQWSDYDIGILGKKELPPVTKVQIEGELEESDIPYAVDVVDFALVSDKFKKIALRKVKIWSNPKL